MARKKNIIQGKAQRKRSRRRHPTRFIDQLIKSLTGIRSVAETIQKVENREVWRNIEGIVG